MSLQLHASCTVSITIRHKSLIKFRKIKFFSVLKKTGSYSRNKIFSSVMRWHRWKHFLPCYISNKQQKCGSWIRYFSCKVNNVWQDVFSISNKTWHCLINFPHLNYFKILEHNSRNSNIGLFVCEIFISVLKSSYKKKMLLEQMEMFRL